MEHLVFKYFDNLTKPNAYIYRYGLVGFHLLIKKLLLLFLLFSPILSIAQTDSTATTKDTEYYVDKYSEKIFNGFVDIMEASEPIAKEGFKMVVKAQIAQGIAALLPLIICIICFILGISAYKTSEGHKGDYDILCAIYLGIALFMALISIFTTGNAIRHLVSPEWEAIKEISNLLK